MKVKHTLFLLAFLLSGNLFAQENTLDDRNPVGTIKASFIFHFAYLSEWPEASRTGDEFIIGVFGNDYIYDVLVEKYATQPIGKQILKIKKIENIEDCSSVHIVFIDKSLTDKVNKVVKETNELNVMIVSDEPETIDTGAMIVFVPHNSMIRYKLNQKKAGEKGIVFGNELKSWELKEE